MMRNRSFWGRGRRWNRHWIVRLITRRCRSRNCRRWYWRKSSGGDSRLRQWSGTSSGQRHRKSLRRRCPGLAPDAIGIYSSTRRIGEFFKDVKGLSKKAASACYTEVPRYIHSASPDPQTPIIDGTGNVLHRHWAILTSAEVRCLASADYICLVNSDGARSKLSGDGRTSTPHTPTQTSTIVSAPIILGNGFAVVSSYLLSHRYYVLCIVA